MTQKKDRPDNQARKDLTFTVDVSRKAPKQVYDTLKPPQRQRPKPEKQDDKR